MNARTTPKVPLSRAVTHAKAIPPYLGQALLHQGCLQDTALKTRPPTEGITSCGAQKISCTLSYTHLTCDASKESGKHQLNFQEWNKIAERLQ
eukprot:342231-Pelagomonas_calceolata.AAC.2